VSRNPTSWEGDLVEASGPLATIDLKSRQFSVLHATVDIDGNGPAFSNEPHWAPSGDRIVFSFEAGAAEVDAAGKTLTGLSSLMESDDAPWTHAVGWLGRKCVAFISGKTQKDAIHKPLRVLMLDNQETVSAAQLLCVAEDSLTDLVAFSASLRVRLVDSKLLVEGGRDTFVLPVKDARYVAVQIIQQLDNTRVPGICR